MGAGSGFFSRYLLRHSNAQCATCVDPFYADEKVETEGGKPVHYVREIRSTDADLVLMMDVLEHVEDDLRLLESYVDLLPPGRTCW